MQHILSLGYFKVEVKFPNYVQDFKKMFMVTVIVSLCPWETYNLVNDI
jgi:hypothetical protein